MIHTGLTSTRLGLEEDRVEPLAKTVRHPLLKVLFALFREQLRAQIAEQNQAAIPETQIEKHGGCAQRVVEESLVVIDA